MDATNARAYSLGCGMELMPDPERRLTLTGEKDALGLPRLKLHMRIADADFALYRQTLGELGRQLLASKAGMLRFNCTPPRRLAEEHGLGPSSSGHDAHA